jgi:uncharacterized protein YozE (UPF0346 family)
MTQRIYEPSNFYVWLLKQADKDSPIGDLAKDVKRDALFPRAGSSVEPFREYLMQKSVDSLVIQAIEDAWLEYSESNTSEITGLKKP